MMCGRRAGPSMAKGLHVHWTAHNTFVRYLQQCNKLTPIRVISQLPHIDRQEAPMLHTLRLCAYATVQGVALRSPVSSKV